MIKLHSTKSNIKKIKKLYNEGLSQKQIANIFNLNEKTIIKFMKINNIKARKPKEFNTKIHLTKIQIKNIWKFYSKGFNRIEIAEKLKISEGAVRKIIQGNCRPHGESTSLRYKRLTKKLNYEQQQFIFGSLLGDSHLACRIRHERGTDKEQLEFSVGHCEKQKGYIEHIAKLLGTNISCSIQGPNSFGTGNKQFRTAYYNKYELLPIHKLCFRNNKKTVSKDWTDKIDALALAYWFMDDGTSVYYSTSTIKKNKKGVSVLFCTQSFTKSDHKLLQKMLQDKFEIKSTITKCKDGTGYLLKIKGESVNNLMDIVSPHVNLIKCMRYKIKYSTSSNYKY